MDTSNHLPNYHDNKKAKRVQPYISPFILEARRKAEERARQAKTSRSKVPNKNDWDNNNHTPGYFDPHLKKQEIFKISPRNQRKEEENQQSRVSPEQSPKRNKLTMKTNGASPHRTPIKNQQSSPNLQPPIDQIDGNSTIPLYNIPQTTTNNSQPQTPSFEQRIQNHLTPDHVETIVPGLQITDNLKTNGEYLISVGQDYKDNSSNLIRDNKGYYSKLIKERLREILYRKKYDEEDDAGEERNEGSRSVKIGKIIRQRSHDPNLDYSKEMMENMTKMMSAVSEMVVSVNQQKNSKSPRPKRSPFVYPNYGFVPPSPYPPSYPPSYPYPNAYPNPYNPQYIPPYPGYPPAYPYPYAPPPPYHIPNPEQYPAPPSNIPSTTYPSKPQPQSKVNPEVPSSSQVNNIPQDIQELKTKLFKEHMKASIDPNHPNNLPKTKAGVLDRIMSKLQQIEMCEKDICDYLATKSIKQEPQPEVKLTPTLDLNEVIDNVEFKPSQAPVSSIAKTIQYPDLRKFNTDTNEDIYEYMKELEKSRKLKEVPFEKKHTTMAETGDMLSETLFEQLVDSIAGEISGVIDDYSQKFVNKI